MCCCASLRAIAAQSWLIIVNLEAEGIGDHCTSYSASMTDTFPELVTQSSILQYEQVYPCPVCRHGQISGLMLMDAFACNFCRHIFAANLDQQQIRLADTPQALLWRWNGKVWRPQHHQANLTLSIWLIAFVLAILPGGLVWLGYYVFPPLPGSQGDWFPLAWVGLAFLVHLSIVFWLLLEYYQVPLYITSRVQARQWRE